MWKKVLKFFVLFYVPLLGLTLYLFWSQKKEIKDNLSQISQNSTEYKKNVFTSVCQFLINDISYWSAIRYPKDFDPLYKHSEFMGSYLDLIKGKGDYDQFRFLDLNGQEFFRVEQSSFGNLQLGELQDKSKRNYVKQGLALENGQIYLSEINLNREHGEIEKPYNPVLRAIAPIYNKNEEKIGIVVINFKMEPILKQLKSEISIGDFYLIDSNLNIITSSTSTWDIPYEMENISEEPIPVKTKFDLNDKTLLEKDTLFYDEYGIRTIKHLDFNKPTTNWNPISSQVKEIVTPTKWIIAKEIPTEVLRTRQLPIIQNLALLNFLAIILLLGISYVFIRSRKKEEEFLIDLESKNYRLNRKKEQLRESNLEINSINQRLTTRNKQLEEFNYLVSHNLRAPVTSMSTIVDMIKKEKEPGQLTNLLPKLDQIASSIYNLTEDIGEYISILDKKDIKVKELDLNLVIAQIKKEFTETLFEDNDFKVLVKLEAWSQLNFSKFYLHSVLQNLLSNAIKYRRGDVSAFVCFETAIEENQKILYVRDNGIGINLERHQENIFKLYKRFHRNVSGKGMGLFLVKSQLEVMGASIHIESEEGVGTTFKIKFK